MEIRLDPPPAPEAGRLALTSAEVDSTRDQLASEALMHSPKVVLASILLAFPIAAAGCSGDDATGPDTGALEVSIVLGGEPDSDGYTLEVDDGDPQVVGPGASIQIAGLTPGDHHVSLGGVAVNCTVLGTLAPSGLPRALLAK
jgi:hypothetical protein